MEKNPRHEYLDDTPVAIPTKFRRQSWADQMREFVRSELSRQADAQGLESFEEADDFYLDDEDEPLPRTRYELDEGQLYYAPEPEPSPEPGSAPEGSTDTPPPSPESGSGEG